MVAQKSLDDHSLRCWPTTVLGCLVWTLTASRSFYSSGIVTDGLIATIEFSKRPSQQTGAEQAESATAATGSTASSAPASRYNPHHVTSPCSLSLAEVLAISDVVISAVPVESYKVPTKYLKDGCVCVNVAGEKNFEADVRDRVSLFDCRRCSEADRQASIYVPSVGVMTIAMLQRNL